MIAGFFYFQIKSREAFMENEKIVPKYNNAGQEAERLGVPVAWIWKKARNGQIPASKIGKYYFFDPRQTDEWIKSQGS
jgi:hypothetical protein